MTDGAATQATLLLVDDKRENLAALEAILKRPDYRLLSVTSGTEALAVALREHLSVVLLDVVMPGMDGFEVARHLKQLDRTRDVPILFLTAVATDVREIYRAYEVGAVDYLVKPLDAEVVRRKVAVFVDLVRQREEIERQTRRLREAERREYEVRSAELRLAGDRRYRKLVEGIDHAVAWTANDSGVLTFVSRQAPRILGFSLEEMVQPDFWDRILHPEDREDVLSVFRRALVEGTDLACNHRVVVSAGGTRWFHTAVSGERPPEGSPELHGMSVDVTDLKRSEEVQALLGDVGALLAESLDYRITLPKVARRLVPLLAELCLIDEVTDSGTLREVAVAHSDPSLEEQVRQLGRRSETDQPAPSGIAAVARSGRPELHPEVPSVEWLAEALGAQSIEAVRDLPAASCIFHPLRARDRILGVLTLVCREPRRYGQEELRLAEIVSRRAAVSMDNALLYEEARRASRAREELLAVVSHDLRSPLSAVVASAALLEQAAARRLEPERVKKSAGVILRSADRMERLINDLIDFARIQAGQLSLERQRVGARSLVRDAIEGHAQVAAEKAIRLEGSASGPFEVFCDRDRTLQILSNLIGNALKFTPRGGSVTVRAEPVDRRAQLTVADTGTGMSEAQLSRMWDRAWQAQRTRGEGLGLGLAIARGLVEAQGGEIRAESRVGEGTRVCFTLPLAEGTEPSGGG